EGKSPGRPAQVPPGTRDLLGRRNSSQIAVPFLHPRSTSSGKVTRRGGLMSTGLDHLVTHLRRALEPARLDDREPLDPFPRDRDPDAFQAPVRRHGPRGPAPCRKVLPAPAGAGEAVPATLPPPGRHGPATPPRAARAVPAPR